MYQQLKKIASGIFPYRFIKKHEPFFRKLIALNYKGKTYNCNVCGYGLRTFVKLEKKGKLCPNCGSLPRTRWLSQFIEDEINVESKSLLHFSPPKSLSEKLKKSTLLQYITTDFENEFTADKKLDITAIDEPSNSYDIIICFHVLEHIIEDIKAMKELFRILKKEGKCILQTPFKEGTIYEDFSITSEEARLKHFGQEDHVRVYSVKGLKNRLESVGFTVEVFTFEATLTNTFGFPKKSVILVANKT